mmetsp:Transcript_78325/g.155664  ORF Transcript_78325/g.155664 Transcript_78325/m.155664 type:complete len:203 (+) Transcript_78325:284-892(+)
MRGPSPPGSRCACSATRRHLRNAVQASEGLWTRVAWPSTSRCLCLSYRPSSPSLPCTRSSAQPTPRMTHRSVRRGQAVPPPLQQVIQSATPSPTLCLSTPHRCGSSTHASSPSYLLSSASSESAPSETRGALAAHPRPQPQPCIPLSRPMPLLHHHSMALLHHLPTASLHRLAALRARQARRTAFFSLASSRASAQTLTPRY